MDLLAYGNIENLNHYLTENGIDIPRLRGLCLCTDMEPWTEEEIKHASESIVSQAMEDAIASYWFRSCGYCYGSRNKKKLKRYAIKKVDKENKRIRHIPRWDRIHGKHRKALKYEIKLNMRNFEKYRTVWDKYCGREDVIRIHARIGGPNWYFYDGPSLVANHPNFLEKVDDWYDCTYCDIYMKINKEVN